MLSSQRCSAILPVVYVTIQRSAYLPRRRIFSLPTWADIFCWMNNNCNWALWGLPRTNCPREYRLPLASFITALWASSTWSVANTWDCPWDKGAQVAAGLNPRAATGQEPMCHGWGAHLGLPCHMGCQNCYPAKLGSLHPQAVKPIYWQQAVVKERVLFIAGRQARSSGLLNISCLNSAWRPAINATLFFITTQCQ